MPFIRLSGHSGRAMKHSDLGLRKYLTEVLGVREVMGRESSQREAPSAKLRSVASESSSVEKLMVVVGRKITASERQLIQKMLKAIDETQFKIWESSEAPPTGGQALLAMSDAAVALCRERGGELYHTFDPIDLIEGDPFTVKQRKAQAWETLKELREFLRSNGR